MDLDQAIARQLDKELNYFGPAAGLGGGSGIPDYLGATDSTNTNTNSKDLPTPHTAPEALFDEENIDRQADNYNYDMLMGENGENHDSTVPSSCCHFLCGTPSVDEPKINMLCCKPTRRVVKNLFLFLLVLLIYIFFL